MKKHLKIKYGTNSRQRHKSSGRFQEHDINSKRIFSNPILCAQFLREYSGLPALKNVQPEDIELVKVRYHLFTGAESNPDSVVRVWLQEDKRGLPLYIIPLIEHKSSVDYNAGMQLLTYMVCIWKDWEKEMRDKHHLNCKTRDFRYPFIFPIVYYEGADKWTADTHLSSRIFMSDSMKKYIPDFTYHLVQTHDYTNQELLEKKDEMSLLMMLNKIQKAEDFSGFQNLMTADVDTLLKGTPESVVEIIAGTAQSLCRKLNVPEEETNDYISRLRKERKMGYLFENMEKMDIQLERKLRKEAQDKLQATQTRLQAELHDTQTELHDTQAELHNALQTYIRTLQEFQCSRTEAKQRLQNNFSLNAEQAEAQLKLYWKNQTN